MPAHASKVDEVNLSTPRERLRRFDPKRRVGLFELALGDDLPPRVEIRHVDPNHEVFGEPPVIELLQDELRVAAAETRVAAVLPDFLKADLREEPATGVVVLPTRHERKK